MCFGHQGEFTVRWRKIVFVRTCESFTRTGTLCLLLSNGISLVFPRLADPISGIWLFSGQSTTRTEGGWLQCRARQVMLDQSTTIKFILVPIEWNY